MNFSEINRLKSFYEKANFKEQASVRNLLAGRNYEESARIFNKINIDGEEFCDETTSTVIIPDQLWELLEHDSAIDTIEDLAAAQVLWFYENHLKNQIGEQKFSDIVQRSLRRYGFHKEADQEKEGLEVRNESFDFRKVTERLLSDIPILDKEKFIGQARLFVKMKEGETLRIGRNERSLN